MLFKPLIGAELSGSVGGITASRNKGGAFFRVRVVPIDPGTPAQSIVRQAMGTLASRWQTGLDAPQRVAWETYAENVPLLNRLGDSVNVTGLNMYQRSNVIRLQNGLARVDDAPTIFNLGDFTAPTIQSLLAPTAVSIGFTDTDDWVGEDGAAMLWYGSRNTAPSIVFFKGPYRAFTLQILGDAITPVPSPFAGVNPFNLSVGNKGFFQVRVTRADGRLSQVQRIEAIAG